MSLIRTHERICAKLKVMETTLDHAQANCIIFCLHYYSNRHIKMLFMLQLVGS